MKKTTSNNRSKKISNQRSSVKNWTTGLRRSRRQRLIAFFLLGFAVVGSYLVITSMAASKPRYFGYPGYWMGRVRACVSGEGVWDKENYDAPGGAYGFTRTQWDNYAGVRNAEQASPRDQDEKFIAVWSSPSQGSNPWKDSADCWEPAGTISGAPCLPVPKNPIKES